MIRRSMAGFGLLATLAVGSLVLFWLQTRTLESSAGVLNVSGRQRMLSQRAALVAEAFVHTGAPQRRETLRRELEAIAERMERAHYGLVHGSPELDLPRAAPASVRRLYFEGPGALDEQVRAYLEALRELIRKPRPTPLEPPFLELVETATEGRLLATLDAVVGSFQAHQERQVALLQRAMLIVFLVTLAVIVAMRRRVVDPMVRRVRRYIRQQRRHDERLAHVSRLSTMGEMAAGIAHEINQPLSAILTYAKVMQRMIAARTATAPEQAENLEKIAIQADRAAKVIQRVRSLFEQRDAERAPAEVAAVVQEAIDLAEVGTRFHDARIELEAEAGLPTVVIDQIQIQQVVLNLVRNALEAQEAASRDDPIRVTAQRHDAGIVVEVSDHGIGVPDGAELFEPFYSTKDSGMGMGLSVSRSIVNAHGGQLGFESPAGGGTRFWFTLPVERGTSVQPEGRPSR